MFGLKLLSKLLEEEKPEVNERRCVRRFRRATCDRCLQDCPTQAIQLESAPHIDGSRCVGCGICSNACPTGAFASPTARRLASSTKANGAGFHCSRAQNGRMGGIEVPCLGILGEGTLIAAVLAGKEGRNILPLDVSHCHKCELKSALGVVERTVARANSVLSALGSPKAIVLNRTEREPAVAEQQQSRRAFLNYVRGQALKAAAESMDGILDEALLLSRPPQNSDDNIPINRALLHYQIETLLARSGEEIRRCCIPFGTPSPPDRCDFCGICAMACPSGALRTYETDDEWELRLEVWKCLDCRACIDTCPTSGLRYRDRSEALQVVARQQSVLVHVDKATCASCGRKFAGSHRKDICPSCEKRIGVGDHFSRGSCEWSRASSKN